jgi:hypothetical protein
MYADEMRELTLQHSARANPKPCSADWGDPGHSQYDDVIAFWTSYWNDVFNPSEPLSPNFVKVLIFTESSFNSKATNGLRGEKMAAGLMQITVESWRLLGGQKGGVSDHSLHFDKKDLVDPVVNIASGIRWLFEKKRLADARFKRNST